MPHYRRPAIRPSRPAWSPSKPPGTRSALPARRRSGFFRLHPIVLTCHSLRSPHTRPRLRRRRHSRHLPYMPGWAYQHSDDFGTFSSVLRQRAVMTTNCTFRTCRLSDPNTCPRCAVAFGDSRAHLGPLSLGGRATSTTLLNPVVVEKKERVSMNSTDGPGNRLRFSTRMRPVTSAAVAAVVAMFLAGGSPAFAVAETPSVDTSDCGDVIQLAAPGTWETNEGADRKTVPGMLAQITGPVEQELSSGASSVVTVPATTTTTTTTTDTDTARSRCYSSRTSETWFARRCGIWGRTPKWSSCR